MADNKDNKKEQDKTSTETSIKDGQKAIEVNKEISGVNDDKKEEGQQKDAEQWRNEG